MSNAATGPALLEVLPLWWRVAKLWFTGPERWKARGYALATVVLALVTTLLMVRISYAQKAFSTSLAGKDEVGFQKAVGDFIVIICVAIPFFSFNLFMEDRLVLAWRAYLTSYFLHAYFRDHTYFRIKQADDATSGGMSDDSVIDNPDQRICDDVAAFVRSSTDICLSFVKKVINCVAFAGVLWSISKILVIFMTIYAFFGTLLTTSFFGKILTKLMYEILKREGDLRFSLVRVREAAESIAFYSGNQAEAAVVHHRFMCVLETSLDRIRWLAMYDVWTRALDYATILAPSIITAPRYFKGEIEFGTISQASFAFQSISSALSIIIRNLGQIAGLAAQTERLDGLLTLMQRCHEMEARDRELQARARAKEQQLQQQQQQGVGKEEDGAPLPPGAHPSGGGGNLVADLKASLSGGRLTVAAAAAVHRGGQELELKGELGGCMLRMLSPTKPPGLSVRGLALVLPNGLRIICQDLDLELAAGQSLLIVGPSGCGKSSLLRAFAGLWKRGRGTISMPQAVFFLPQKPFMPIGSLKHQLTFPTGLDPPHHARPHGVFAPPAAAVGPTGGTLSPAWRAVAALFPTWRPHQQQHDGWPWPRPLLSVAGGKTAGAQRKHGIGGGGRSMRRHAALPGSEDGGGQLGLAAHEDTTAALEMAPLLSGGNSGGGAPGAGHGDGLAMGVAKPKSFHVVGVSARSGGGGAALEGGEEAEGLGGMRLGAVRAADEELRALLQDVQLDGLEERVGGLDAECDWGATLSSGEQQRVAMLRLLLHHPALAFLDEATSALDNATEAKLYRLLKDQVPSYVSVGHRPQLLQYHTHVLEARPCGAGMAPDWVLTTSEQYQAHLSASTGMAL